jgi:hypothetical protein
MIEQKKKEFNLMEIHYHGRLLERKILFSLITSCNIYFLKMKG